MKWFKQLSNECFEANIAKLRVTEGMEAFGLYHYCLQLIAMDVNEHNLTFELQHDSEVLASLTGLSISRVHHLIGIFVQLRLFENVEGRILCIKLMHQTDEYTAKLIKKKSNEIIILNDSGQTPDKVRSIRLDKIRLDKIRLDNKNNRAVRFAPPTLKEIQDYFAEKRYPSLEAEVFFDFYESKGWMVGKNKMKKWKSAAANWMRKKDSTQTQNMHNEDWTK